MTKFFLYNTDFFFGAMLSRGELGASTKVVGWFDVWPLFFSTFFLLRGVSVGELSESKMPKISGQL
jgi:hypothetical protein